MSETVENMEEPDGRISLNSSIGTITGNSIYIEFIPTLTDTILLGDSKPDDEKIINTQVGEIIIE